MNSFTAIAAAVSSAANSNASAGIFNYGSPKANDKNNLLATTKKAISQSESPDCNSDFHQIGTNLAEQSVCWHKKSMLDNCQFCGHPFYEANQFLCEKCNGTEKEILNNQEKFEQDLEVKTDQVDTPILTNENLQLDLTSMETMKTMETALTSENIAKNNFELEFSSLLLNSHLSSAVDSLLLKHSQSLVKLSDQIDLISNTISVNSISPFSPKDLIEQIKLFNKYNTSNINALKYELKQNNIKIFGVLKIHWNLKNPIKISIAAATQSSNHETIGSKQDSFKATSVKDLNEKKCWDDSSLLKNNLLQDNQSSPNSKNFPRSHSVKLKPSKWKRPHLNMLSGEAITENAEIEEQKFIPSYGSVSSICIESQTTCAEAIKILLEKFHISNSAEEYSLYKVYQTGDKKELKESDFPLIQRLWMGPFNEDKIFIMEKGRQLNINQDLKNLICLPDALLVGLIENSRAEELKEINNIRTKYSNYLKALQENFKRQE